VVMVFGQHDDPIGLNGIDVRPILTFSNKLTKAFDTNWLVVLLVEVFSMAQLFTNVLQPRKGFSQIYVSPKFIPRRSPRKSISFQIHYPSTFLI
jgi:hypothetical protein